MNNKIYLAFAAETDLAGKVIIPEYFFESRAFKTKENAKQSLLDWMSEIVMEDEELEIQENGENEYIIIRHTTSWGEDFDVPNFRCWMEEKEFED